VVHRFCRDELRHGILFILNRLSCRPTHYPYSPQEAGHAPHRTIPSSSLATWPRRVRSAVVQAPELAKMARIVLLVHHSGGRGREYARSSEGAAEHASRIPAGLPRVVPSELTAFPSRRLPCRSCRAAAVPLVRLLYLAPILSISVSRPSNSELRNRPNRNLSARCSSTGTSLRPVTQSRYCHRQIERLTKLLPGHEECLLPEFDGSCNRRPNLPPAVEKLRPWFPEDVPDS